MKYILFRKILLKSEKEKVELSRNMRVLSLFLFASQDSAVVSLLLNTSFMEKNVLFGKI